MTRALIVGASGFVGHYLIQRLVDSASWHVAGTYQSREPETGKCSWHRADVTRPEQLEEAFRLARPDVVVHLAAMADVGQCHREPERASEVNVQGARNVLALCRQYRSRIVFLSTEYVFRGDGGPYQEVDAPEPTTQYGQTKLEAEQAVAQHAYPWTILRTSLIYGWPPGKDRSNLVTTVIDSLSSGRPAYGHTNMYRSPVYVEDLVEGTVKLLEEGHTGVFHLAGPDWAHMGEFVQAIAEVFRLDRSLIQETESPTEGTNGPRPEVLGLDSTQTIKRLGVQPMDMVSGLKKMQTRRREIP